MLPLTEEGRGRRGGDGRGYISIVQRSKLLNPCKHKVLSRNKKSKSEYNFNRNILKTIFEIDNYRASQ